MKNRKVVPSYVAATCVHAFVGIAAVPRTNWSALAEPCIQAPGFEAPLAEYKAYDNAFVPSLRTTHRHPVPEVGLIHASIDMPLVSSSDAASGMFTQPFAAKDSAAPV